MNTYNNIKSIVKTAVTFALAFCITATSAIAGIDKGDSVKVDNKAATEEAIIIEDLWAEFEKEEAADQLIEASEVTFEVYNQNNQLVFTGTQAEWDNDQDTEVVTLKRKAEFLFETDGTSIYKVF